MRLFWYRWLLPLAHRLVRSLRIDSGNISTGFHHFLFGWQGRISRLQARSGPDMVSVPDSLHPDSYHQHFFHPRFIWSLSEGRFHAASGTVLLRGTAVRESLGSSTKVPPRTRLCLIAPAKRIPAKVVPVAARPWNYYHWLLEDLPAVIDALDCEPEAQTWIGANSPRYALESLELAGVTRINRARTDLHIGRLILSGRSEDSGWPHPADVSCLRRRFLPSQAADKPLKKLYISRAEARRPVANEKALRNLMESRGLAVIQPEKMSFAEQVAIFSQAELIVGVHGAGLANLVFAPEGAQVIELAPRDRAIQCFEVICKHLGLVYQRSLFGMEPYGAVRTVSPELRPVIDLDELEVVIGP